MESYKESKFTDYAGVTHILITCYDIDDNNVLKFGWSLQNPSDAYNEKLGKQIAKNRMDATDNYIVSLHSGIILENKELLFDLYTDYLLKYPGIMIKGYNKKKKDYLKDKALKNEFDNMTDEEKKKITYQCGLTPQDLEKAKQYLKFL